MTTNVPRKLPTTAVMLRIARFLRPYAWHYSAGILGIGIANLAINVFMAQIIMNLFSGILEASGPTLAAATRNMAILGASLVVWVFFSVIPLYRSMVGFENDVRRTLFRKFTGAPLADIERRHSGDLLTRANSGLNQASGLFMGNIQNLLSALLPGVGCGAYMLLLDARMGAAGVACSAVPLVVNVLYGDRLRKAGREVQEKQAAFTERMSDLLRGADTVRHLNLQGFAADRAQSSSNDLRSSVQRHVRLDSLRQLCDGASSLASVAFVAYASYIAVREPGLAPTAVAMGQLASSVRFMFDNLGRVISSIQSNVAGAERVLEVLDIPDEPEKSAASSGLAGPAQDTADLDPADPPALSVFGLSFRYPGSNDGALKGVSFSTGIGRRVALVGPSGGGKSTLVKVLLGLYSPEAGDIRVCGKSIYDTPLKEWRSLFSYVPQVPFLFAGTVYENILGGMEDPGEERVMEAARLANAHDFIVAMQGGYGTKVTERGENLSGGERQRIAIARAVLRDAPILLLDEATSSLDAESEALVQEALDRLMEGRTTVVVAHRLSTVRRASEILYMAEGRILERGSHEALMDQGGLYRSLVEQGIRQ
ncbi:MAG: ABC transporter ATP-binding protein [Bacillota bacterium]